MVVSDRCGCTIREYDAFKTFLDKLKVIGIPLESEVILYYRDVGWDGSPCDICGGNKLINGIGRYIINDPLGVSNEYISLCGYCTNLLSERWGINLEFD